MSTIFPTCAIYNHPSILYKRTGFHQNPKCGLESIGLAFIFHILARQ